MSQRVGLIGCGNISEVYLLNARRFASFDIVACADLNESLAQDKAARHGIAAQSVGELLANPGIDIVLNLTPPQAHAEVSLAALAQGKHVYSEKPLAISGEFAAQIVERAAQAGLRVGSAPDTLLGAGIQTAARLIDAGELGPVIFGTAAILSHGMEHWHPDPRFFFKPGGGPVLDMGPYYVGALVTLLGPVQRVLAAGCIGNATRTVSTPTSALLGQSITPEVLTTVSGILQFAGGAQVTLVASWDAWAHRLPRLELHGVRGSLDLPDPNWFGGTIGLARSAGAWVETSVEDQTFGRPNWDSSAGRAANYRGLGLADMAASIERGEPHQVGAEFALHVLRVLLALNEAAAHGGAVELPVAAFPAPRLSEQKARALWTDEPPSGHRQGVEL